MSYSIIIPSRTLSNLKACIHAIRIQDIGARIIVVWDRPEDDPLDSAHVELADPFNKMEGLLGVKPFVFARAVNQGIAAAGTDDVILLNDDAQLQTRGGFDMLSLAAQRGEKYGVLSALILGMAAAPDQCANADRIRLGQARPAAATVDCKHHMLAFMAVYIRREVLDLVGHFDEQFVGYGYDDDDYCKRILLSGLELGVEYSCLVEHGSLPSTYRGQGQAAGFDLLAENRAIFQEKWRGL